MTDGAAREVSGLSGADECGQARPASRSLRGGLNWSKLLLPENGGPGESPGRSLAIERTAERTAERIAKFGQKKARGSTKSKAWELGRPRTRALGM